MAPCHVLEKRRLDSLKSKLAEPSKNKKAITDSLKSLKEPGFELAIARAKELIVEYDSADVVTSVTAASKLDNLIVAVNDVDLGTANIDGLMAAKKICEAAKGTNAMKVIQSRCT